MALPDRLKAEVTAIVAEVAEVEPHEVAADARLEDLGIDSLGGLRIVAQVEKKYRIVIPEGEIGKIRTMEDVFALVDRHAPEVG